MTAYLEIVLGDSLGVSELEFRSCRRNKVFIALDSTSGLVVEMMRGPPGVVGDEKEGVQSETSDMVYPAVGRQCTVTSLMAERPEASPGDTLPEPVRRPETPFGTELNPWAMGLEGSYERLDVGSSVLIDELDFAFDPFRNKRITYGENDGEESITGDVRETLEGALLVQMFWNGLVDLLQGDLGDLVIGFQTLIVPKEGQKVRQKILVYGRRGNLLRSVIEGIVLLEGGHGGSDGIDQWARASVKLARFRILVPLFEGLTGGVMQGE